METDVLAQGARLPDPPAVRECSLCGLNIYAQSHFKGSLHMAKAKVAETSGHNKTPTSSVPPMALPDEDLAALCRERMHMNPGFVALIGLVIP
ncbi:hypothetical protein MRX96_005824 [Rhipicephalus microplus]